MTVQEAKEYLRQVEFIDESVRVRLEQIERMDAMSQKCTSVLTGMPRGGSGSDFTKIRDRMIEESEKYAKEMQRLLDLKTQVAKQIARIGSGRSRIILEGKYLNFETWEQIAEELNKDVSTVHRWHSQALRDFCEAQDG